MRPETRLNLELERKSGRLSDPAGFLATRWLGRQIIELKPKETFLCHGEAVGSESYSQEGRAKVTVLSQSDKEATITLLFANDFVGQKPLATIVWLHLATAAAVNTGTALKINPHTTIRVIHDEPAVADPLLKCLPARGMGAKADLVGQLFNSS